MGTTTLLASIASANLESKTESKFDDEELVLCGTHLEESTPCKSVLSRFSTTSIHIFSLSS